MVVAGGGPGGLEATRVAALKGHQVVEDILLGGARPQGTVVVLDHARRVDAAMTNPTSKVTVRLCATRSPASVVACDPVCAKRSIDFECRLFAMRFGMGFVFQNYRDWDRFLALEAGVSPEEVGEMVVSDADVLREHMELADLVEPLGLDTLWAFEQHAAPYIEMPDPNQFLSYFAGRTKRIDVGAMIVVLTWHNPFRVAEQISMLQHHLNGRYYFMGVGRGLARRNFDAMNVPIDESRERFWEAYEILRLAFTQEMFSFEGEFHSYRNASLRPRPLDPKIVTDAWGTWTSEGTLRQMAERGLQPMTTPNKTLESYIADMKLYDEIRAERGYGPAPPADPPDAAVLLRGRARRAGRDPAVDGRVGRLDPADVRARHRELRAGQGVCGVPDEGLRLRQRDLRGRARDADQQVPRGGRRSGRRRSAPRRWPTTARRSIRPSWSS